MAATAYAAFADVNVRAGRWASLFAVAGAHPNQTDVEQLLEDCNGQIDVAIQARGFTPATMDAAVIASLKDVSAYGALGRALAGVPDPPDDLEKLQKWALMVWGAAMGDPAGSTDAARRGSISTGTFPGVALLESGSGGPSAGDFWTDEPQYGSAESLVAEASRWTADTAEQFAKGQSL